MNKAELIAAMAAKTGETKKAAEASVASGELSYRNRTGNAR